MNDTEKRIAIAKACHWTDIDWETNYFVSRSTPAATLRGNNPNGNRWELPNYLNDLNAMHEAENVLNEIQGCIFSDHLFRILNSSEGVSEFMKIHATAAQRAEAFLRTLDLWKP